jgi:hypothetical protein
VLVTVAGLFKLLYFIPPLCALKTLYISKTLITPILELPPPFILLVLIAQIKSDKHKKQTIRISIIHIKASSHPI